MLAFCPFLNFFAKKIAARARKIKNLSFGPCISPELCASFALTIHNKQISLAFALSIHNKQHEQYPVLNLTGSVYDDQPSVWGVFTSSIFISLSFITPRPFHFLSTVLVFSVIINKIVEIPQFYLYLSFYRVYSVVVELIVMIQKEKRKTEEKKREKKERREGREEKERERRTERRKI